MKKNVYEKGFTLIELLVVIAIIGILASVVLASLNSARSKGADAAIKANLNNIRPQAELFYDSNSNAYAGGTGLVSAVAACPTSQTSNTAVNFNLMGDTNFFNGVSGANTQGGECAWFNTGSAWAVAVVYRSDTARAWCVDSTGQSKEVNNGGTAYNQTTLNADISTTTGCGS